MTTRTLVPSRPVRTRISCLLAARGDELRVLLLVVLATLLLCGALLPVGHDATVAPETSLHGSWQRQAAGQVPLPLRDETPTRGPTWVALESWGQPHGLR